MKIDCNSISIKLEASLLNFIAAISLFFTPITGVFIAVGAFVILDTCFGWWKASKVDSESPSSYKLRKGFIPKSLAYLGLVSAFYILDRFLINQLFLKQFGYEFLLTKLMALFLIIVEIISIDEKWKAVKGESMLVILKKIIKTLKELFKDVKSFNSPDKNENNN